MKLLNDGWLFAKGEAQKFAPVDIPHDWLICDPHHFYTSGIGWYKRPLVLPSLQVGQRVFLRFDGVYMDSTLFVNDRTVGSWKYGYTAFAHDITDFLIPGGTNTLLLKVDYKAPSARWYTGAGIYRDVFLIIKNPCHFIQDGIYITTAFRDGQWQYEVDAEVETYGEPYTLRHTLLDVGEGEEIVPWDVENPRLYTLRSELIVGGEVTDTQKTRFGFRMTAFSPDDGFMLNGRPLKIKGVCLHHDLGGLGARVHRDAIVRQLNIFRKMGVNAIRTAHNPPASVFMDLADEMGFLVMSEILDMWRLPKNTYDYARFFDEWVERDIAAWIRRDRNHPSVILWSLGNEIYDTHHDAREGMKTLRYLMEQAHRHDPKGHAPVTLSSNYMHWENTQRCVDLIKVIGYNYAEYLYDAHHKAHPDWVIFGGETCSTTQSRGVYHFPLAKSMLADDDLQCSALGNTSTSWGAKSVEACIQAEIDAPYSLGQFVWAGQDYLGEPTPYHTKNAYLGHVDTAGFPKDSYYLFQAAWTDPKKAPMVRLYPYWDFSPGQPIDVRACTNAPKVALFLNGEPMGEKALEGGFVADWQIPYRPGTLEAVAYDESGREVARAVQRSFGDAVSLHMEEERVGELIFVTITARDQEGYPVENANRRVNVAVEGGKLLCLDNGDATDYQPYQADSRRLFSGKLLAVVQAIPDITPVIRASLDEADIPIRKIQLSQAGSGVHAQLFPPNATFGDLTWRLADAGGIDSPLADFTVAEDGRSVTILPKGDGTVYVRCAAKNGADHGALISLWPIRIAGKGKASLDPYTFIAGGLYSASNVELTNGNDRGVATLRDGESHVGFEGLDFGDYGSDAFLLPLFPLLKEPFTFEVWEGMPLSGGVKLCDLVYDKGSVWNTYQETTYRLPKRLCGVATLCFVFRQKVHIKGFQFIRLEKAFQRLHAAECDAVYGDSLTVNGTAIERIGNNVTLVYRNMDFGTEGASRVVLCWRSAQPKNSIQLLFADDHGERREMVEVRASEGYTHAAFSLSIAATGKKTVSLLFLPGCNLDLAWIEFIR